MQARSDISCLENLEGHLEDGRPAKTVLEQNGYQAWLEASRRLGDAWRLSLESRIFTDVPPEDPGYLFRKDDYVQVELAWYF